MITLASCSIAPYAAVVNGQTISVSSLNDELAQISSNRSFVAQVASANEQVFGTGTATYNAKFTAQILNRRISVVLVEQALKARGLAITKQDLAIGASVAASGFGGASVFSQFPGAYQSELAHDTAALDVLEAHLVGVKINPSTISAYYQSHQAALTEFCASQILVGSQAEANLLRAKIAGGATFASVAQAYSKDPNTSQNGGAVGCGRASDYAEAFGSAFSAAVTTLPLNTVSTPIQISAGWTIVEVTAKTLPPIASVLSVVVSDLLGTQAQALLGSFIQSKAKGAAIKVNPTYGSIAFSGTSVGVTAPLVPSAAAQYYFPTPK